MLKNAEKTCRDFGNFWISEYRATGIPHFLPCFVFLEFSTIKKELHAEIVDTVWSREPFLSISAAFLEIPFFSKALIQAFEGMIDRDGTNLGFSKSSKIKV